MPLPCVATALRWGRPLVVALGAAGCGGGPSVAAAPPTAAEARPDAVTSPEPVVVAIVVDQLASWMAEERFDLLPQSGGFARLRREGVFVPQMRFSHANSATAPGHAALFTGAPPRETGITNNGFMDSSVGRFVSILDDPKTRTVGRDGVEESHTSFSAAALNVPTVADMLRSQRPDAVIVSLSLKDRGAIFGGGRKPTTSLWFDTSLDQVVTSTAFHQELPSWATGLATAAYLKELRREPWKALRADWTAQHATADAHPGEGDYRGLGTTFPHDVAGAEKPAKAFRATPRGDALVFDLAEAALDHHADDRPLLLTLSLSSHDYVGHVFGPHSWEMWEELAALDRALADFLDSLERRFGSDGFAVMLSADHGVSPTPEAWAARPESKCRGELDAWQRPCGPITRLLPKDLVERAQKAAEQIQPGKWIRGMANPYILFTETAKKDMSVEGRAVLVEAVSRSLEKLPGVAKVYDPPRLPASCPPVEDESLDALVCRSVALGQGGDLYVLLRPGYYLDVGYTVGHGTNHGSPYLYDRAVPLLVRAPSSAHSGKLMSASVDFRAYSRTLSALLGIDPPLAAQGGLDLTELE